jgi:hypothetical protein
VIAADYGPLGNLVATAGAVVAAGGAIGLAWRGRSRWGPSEEDVPGGADKVGALLATLAIVLMWADWRSDDHIGSLEAVAIGLGIGAGVAFLAYIYLIGVQTYDVPAGAGPSRKIIGGFWLTPRARKARQENDVSVQELLAGAAYNPDRLWSRPSRQLAKLSFQVCYLALTTCGTVALAAAAIRLGLATG